MSLHPSLKIDTATVKQRSVLTRIERIKDLMKKGLWLEGRSVLGLPKTKIMKLKATKTKKEEEAPAAGAAAAPAETKAAPAKEAKETKDAKQSKETKQQPAAKK